VTKFHVAGFKGSPQTRGRKGAPTLKDVILPLLARLPWKWLQIGTDMLLIITSTALAMSFLEMSRSMTLN